MKTPSDTPKTSEKTDAQAKPASDAHAARAHGGSTKTSESHTSVRGAAGTGEHLSVRDHVPDRSIAATASAAEGERGDEGEGDLTMASKNRKIGLGRFVLLSCSASVEGNVEPGCEESQQPRVGTAAW